MKILFVKAAAHLRNKIVDLGTEERIEDAGNGSTYYIFNTPFKVGGKSYVGARVVVEKAADPIHRCDLIAAGSSLTLVQILRK